MRLMRHRRPVTQLPACTCCGGPVPLARIVYGPEGPTHDECFEARLDSVVTAAEALVGARA